MLGQIANYCPIDGLTSGAWRSRADESVVFVAINKVS